MKSKQLANVLIKIIGLYVCVCSIPGFVSGMLLVFSSTLGVSWSEKLFGMASYAIGEVVQAAVGIFLISKSQKLANYWFKGDEE